MCVNVCVHAGDSVSRQHYYTLIRQLETTRTALPIRLDVKLANTTHGEYSFPISMYVEDTFKSSRTGATLTTSFIFAQVRCAMSNKSTFGVI